MLESKWLLDIQADTSELERAISVLNEEIQKHSDNHRFVRQIEQVLSMHGFIDRLFTVQKDFGYSQQGYLQVVIRKNELLDLFMDGIKNGDIYQFYKR